MLKLLLGAIVGYVLGTRAGRERYEQLARTCQQVRTSSAVQGAAEAVRTCVQEQLAGRRAAAANGRSR